MRAAVYLGGGEVRIEERPVPRPGPGEVLVAMRACGICGSDLMDWYSATKAPAVLGHEPAGVVVESRGPGLPAPGTRVFVHHHVPCGDCDVLPPRPRDAVRARSRRRGSSRAASPS